jgi:hypothetical protein
MKIGCGCAAMIAAGVASCAAPAARADRTFRAVLSGSEVVPPTGSPGTGSATLTFREATGELLVVGGHDGLLGTVQAIAIHGPADPGQTAPPLFGMAFAGPPQRFFSGAPHPDTEQVRALFRHELYLQIRTTRYPNGEIRGQIVPPPAAAVPLVCGLVLRRRRPA